MNNRTVTIKLLPDYPAVNMKMDASVRSVDMQYAFMEIERHLNNFDHPIYVVVDLTENENLPFQATISGAMFGPYLNPKVQQWLVVGEHKLGQLVAKHLTSWTGENRVLWFDTCEECLEYIEQELLEGAKID